MNLFTVFIASALINNFIMSRFLGICPFLGVSKRLETAAGMGFAVIFVMTLSSSVTYIVHKFILVPLEITYLYNIAFVLIIAGLVQFVEMFMKKSSPGLYQALGIYMPLISTNCAVLGVTVMNMNAGFGFLHSVTNAAGGAAGFTLVIVLFAGIREKMERSDIPKAFRGFPIALVAAGLMAIAFFGFQNLLI